ncbi:radical SAM family heme chaperone HemW [Propionibacteriaceae bacterium Y2011]
MTPGPPPDGDPAPLDGTLPAAALTEVAGRPLSVYVHVPYCRTRCGYCDFNTYTAAELGTGPGASRDTWATAAVTELDLARRVLPEVAGVSTVFFGGGTPTLLPPADLAAVLAAIDDRFGLSPDVEVTTESNPDSVTAADLAQLREAGFNRISFGMQSAVPQVLRVLDREHTPGRAVEVVAEARAAGFDSVSLDLIYGTPGESAADWQTTLDSALAAEPDHVSAYALIVEEGTRLAGRIRRGELAMIDDDVQAERYLQAEETLVGKGFRAYEVSNWATDERHRCRHNIAYWRSDPWWGVGPGAHSHAGGVRWWNLRHPAAWAARVMAGESPAQARELLDAGTRRVELIMLGLRLADGLELSLLTESERARVPAIVAAGHGVVHGDVGDGDGDVGEGDVGDGRGRLSLTLSGRLLADGIVVDLLD